MGDLGWLEADDYYLFLGYGPSFGLYFSAPPKGTVSTPFFVSYELWTLGVVPHVYLGI